MVLSLLSKYNLTIPPAELETWVSREENAVIAKLYESLVPCDGVKEALANVLKRDTIELAVVSSSALRRVKASLEKVDIHDLFGDRVFSAATSLPKPTSKPDPAIYNFAVEKLGKTKEQCLAVEDSRSGTLSARNAGIRVLGYVGSYEEHERGKMSQTLKDAGAEVVMTHWDQFEPILAKL
jgi:HAD superfamily hydrolase (TIGR01509 family)